MTLAIPVSSLSGIAKGVSSEWKTEVWFHRSRTVITTWSGPLKSSPSDTSRRNTRSVSAATAGAKNTGRSR